MHIFGILQVGYSEKCRPLQMQEWLWKNLPFCKNKFTSIHISKQQMQAEFFFWYSPFLPGKALFTGRDLLGLWHLAQIGMTTGGCHLGDFICITRQACCLPPLHNLPQPMLPPVPPEGQVPVSLFSSMWYKVQLSYPSLSLMFCVWLLCLWKLIILYA